MSLAELSRESAVAESTIRKMEKRTAEGEGGTESPLVAIAAVFELPLDYLRNILHGESEKNAEASAKDPESGPSVLEPQFRKLFQKELGPMKKNVATVTREVETLRGIVDRIDQKIDAIIQDQDKGTGAPAWHSGKPADERLPEQEV
jgi:hypothetical protein